MYFLYGVIKLLFKGNCRLVKYLLLYIYIESCFGVYFCTAMFYLLYRIGIILQIMLVVMFSDLFAL